MWIDGDEMTANYQKMLFNEHRKKMYKAFSSAFNQLLDRKYMFTLWSGLNIRNKWILYEFPVKSIRRIDIFGSFVTYKQKPNDMDIAVFINYDLNSLGEDEDWLEFPLYTNFDFKRIEMNTLILTTKDFDSDTGKPTLNNLIDFYLYYPGKSREDSSLLYSKPYYTWYKNPNAKRIKYDDIIEVERGSNGRPTLRKRIKFGR